MTKKFGLLLLLSALVLGMFGAVGAGAQPPPDDGPGALPIAGEGVYSEPIWLPLRGSNEVVCTYFNGCDGGYHIDPAIDFRTTFEEQIYAAGAGQVVELVDGGVNCPDDTPPFICGPGQFANYVTVDHGDGITTRYLHFSSIAVEMNAWVGPNTVLGLAGDTGPSSPGFYHLHFERLDAAGTQVDAGQLYACRGGGQVSYPGSWGHQSWNQVPTGTQSTQNDGTECFQPQRAQVSTVLIIDSTGSMVDNDPPMPVRDGANRGLRLQAAEVYVRTAIPGDQIGVIEFDSDANTVRPLTDIGTFGSDARNDLAQGLRGIDSRGATNLEAGLQAGCDMLEGAAEPNRAAIFLTDGDGGYTGDATECFDRAGWKVFTIGLGSGVAEDLLREIATETEGSYRFLDPDGDRFDVCTFLQIRGEITGDPGDDCDITNVLNQDEIVDYIETVIEGLLQISFITNWPGSDIEMTLTSPSGRVIDRSTQADDLSIEHGPTFEVITISNPEPGDWNVSLLGADIPDGPEPYSFTTVEITDPDPGDPDPGDPDPGDPDPGDPDPGDPDPGDPDPGDPDPGDPDPDADPFVVRAKGDTGDERFEVRVAGAVVGSFDVTTDWNDYSVKLPSGTKLADVQVAFVNDAFRKPYDRNLRVDYVEYEQVRYESESPTTLSTGTYTSASRCKPAKLKSEALHCNGYFQYEQHTGSTDPFVVRAKGDTGDERFEVRVAGAVVGSFDVTTDWNDYSVKLPSGTKLADVQVAFVNDAFRKPYDRNLRVDYVEYEQVRYESESPTTLSTGTYTSASRCKPAKLKSEALHCNGYFQYQ